MRHAMMAMINRSDEPITSSKKSLIPFRSILNGSDAGQAGGPRRGARGQGDKGTRRKGQGEGVIRGRKFPVPFRSAKKTSRFGYFDSGVLNWASSTCALCFISVNLRVDE